MGTFIKSSIVGTITIEETIALLQADAVIIHKRYVHVSCNFTGTIDEVEALNDYQAKLDSITKQLDYLFNN